MRLKSYFSGTVEAAVEQARKELGDDALLVNARPSTPETRHLGAYEVVFGATEAPQRAASPASMKLAGTANPWAAGADGKGNTGEQESRTFERLAQDVAGMRREIERLTHSLKGACMIPGMTASVTTGRAGPCVDSSRAATYGRLLDHELDPAIAQAVAEGAPLESFFETDPTLGRKGADRAVVALVGPPGAGKTTTLIKLAARYGLASRKPAQIITADVFRIAAADQLRSLASILGIGLEVTETPVALAQALEQHRLKEFVFVDTPGLTSREMEDGEDLARVIAGHPEIDTHLVLPASMKPFDLARTIDRYAIFQPKKLLFTRLDETDRYGALISEAYRRGLPLSFLTTGQQIPDDFEAASKDLLVDLVHGATAGDMGQAAPVALPVQDAARSTPEIGEPHFNTTPQQKTAGAAA